MVGCNIYILSITNNLFKKSVTNTIFFLNLTWTMLEKYTNFYKTKQKLEVNFICISKIWMKHSLRIHAMNRMLWMSNIEGMIPNMYD
jgi:hypothetical protein